MSEHALYIYDRGFMNYRVRSFCGSYDMPVDEALGEVTSSLPIDPDDVPECSRCRAVAEVERRAFTSLPERTDDIRIMVALVLKLRYRGYEPGMSAGIASSLRYGTVVWSGPNCHVEYMDYIPRDSVGASPVS